MNINWKHIPIFIIVSLGGTIWPFIGNCQEYNQFIDDWLPLGIEIERVKGVLENTNTQYTETFMRSHEAIILHATIEDNQYMYFIDQENQRCWLVIKDYPIKQLSERINYFAKWNKIEEEELTWYQNFSELYDIVAKMEITDNVISISFSTR